MIESIDAIRNGVCSIGLLPVPLEKYHRDPLGHRLEVCGTGFLISENLVITAAHVLDKLADMQNWRSEDSARILDSQRFVDFTFPQDENHLHTTLRMIRNPNRPRSTSADVAFIEIQREPVQHFKKIRPLEIQGAWEAHVTDKVFAVGFAHGDLLLRGEVGAIRFGPIIQQGYISALAPFDNTSSPYEVLLDLQAARGMSGSPIILERTKKVIGVLYEIEEERNVQRQMIRTTTAFGVPITRGQVTEWISLIRGD